MHWNCTHKYIIHYICVRLCARVYFEEGGLLQDSQLKIFSHIFEKYFRGTGTEFFRTSSKYHPLCRLNLQNNHEIWFFRHRTTSYSIVPPYVGRITSSVIHSNVNNWYLHESSVLCKSCSNLSFPLIIYVQSKWYVRWEVVWDISLVILVILKNLLWQGSPT